MKRCKKLAPALVFGLILFGTVASAAEQGTLICVGAKVYPSPMLLLMPKGRRMVYR